MLFQVLAKFAVVVDLTVEDHGHAPVFVECRLFAGYKIDDCQTPHSQGDAPGNHETLRIRSPMDHSLAHRVQEFSRTVRLTGTRIKIGPTGYSTHNKSSDES